MISIIKNVEVYAPEYIGKKEILITGEKIVGVVNPGEVVLKGIDINEIDARGVIAVPGFIDGHIHIAGAGGDGGPVTRTEGLQLADMLHAGITTVVGCLGTDGFTRNIESVLMKTKQLRALGVSAYMLTGAYQVPTPTLLGDIGRDIALVDEIIGAGEIAVGDHRSSCPTPEEIARIASQARVGGLLGGKSGIVVIHLGSSAAAFATLFEVVEVTQIPPKQFLPTHCSRSKQVMDDAKRWGRIGYCDITASTTTESDESAAAAVVELLNSGVPLEHITMTSDGCGSLPKFNETGELIALSYGTPSALTESFRMLIRSCGLVLADALQIVTSNPARILGLTGKGKIAEGYDADLLLLDRNDLSVKQVIARGAVKL